jgi:hypothetical protein
VIEHRHPMCEINRFVHGEQRHTGAEADAFGQRQRFGNQQIGRRRILPFLGEVLTEPGFVEPQLVGQHQLIDIAVVAIGDRAIGRMQGHHEQAKAHMRKSLQAKDGGRHPKQRRTVFLSCLGRVGFSLFLVS